MKRTCLLIGVLVILGTLEIQAKKNSRQFWSRTSKDADWDKDGDSIDIDIEMSGDDKVPVEDDDDGSDDDGDDLYEGSGLDIVDATDDNEDDDDIEESGSGAIETLVEPVTEGVIQPATDTPLLGEVLTPCKQLRDSSTYANFKPNCTSDGQFTPRQCHPDTRKCWCVDQTGKEVPGTLLAPNVIPDCLFGGNLTSCVFQLVQATQGLVGQYKPNCTETGEYASMQCMGSECFCVDKLGIEIPGTETNKPKMPKCHDNTKVKPYMTPTPAPKESTPTYTILNEGDPDVIVDPDDNGTMDSGDIEISDSDEKEVFDKEEDSNEVNKSERTYTAQSVTMFAKPGILAAIIGGAVVGLLCMVLLVMFIVYRMRKKDEGSYALEEQKYQNYSYSKAPDKEFYA